MKRSQSESSMGSEDASDDYGEIKKPRTSQATSEEEEPPVTPKIDNSNYSSIAQKMMAKMGYQSGKGLGKRGQGIVEPVVASNRRGRRGLGYILKGLEDKKVKSLGENE